MLSISTIEVGGILGQPRIRERIYDAYSLLYKVPIGKSINVRSPNFGLNIAKLLFTNSINKLLAKYIGAGMYVDNEVGAAGATGVGELVMKTCGSFLVVELMRQGYSAMEACNEAVDRIIKQEDGKTKLQVGYIALGKDGSIGYASIQKGFQYALYKDGVNKLFDVKSIF